MSFITLPNEIAVKILSITRPLDIRRCQEVCRRLRDLVAADGYLQYLLELDMCSYVSPSVPRNDLDYTAKTNLLCEHRHRWQGDEPVEPTVIELSPGPVSSLISRDGLLAYISLNSGLELKGALTRLVCFDQLPSMNKGTSHAHWHHKFEFDIICLAIQPENDLVVLLEQGPQVLHLDDGMFAYQAALNYRLHFRTISTGDPHPAAVALLDAAIDLNPTGKCPDRGFVLEVYDNLMAIMYRYWTVSDTASTLVIFDWAAGVELVRLEAVPVCVTSFCFLSPEHFVIPRPASSTRDNWGYSRFTTLGRLDVYHFHRRRDAYQTRPQTPRHIASFLLPDLHTEQNSLRITAHCSVPPVPPNLRMRIWPRCSPRIYESPPQHMLCIKIQTVVRLADEDGSYSLNSNKSSWGALFVSPQVLLDTIYHQVNVTGVGPTISIPWGAWGDDTTWVRSSFNSWYAYGLRAVALQGVTGSPQQEDELKLLLVDFHKTRLRTRRAEGYNFGIPITRGEDDAPETRQGEDALEQAFSNPVDTTLRRHTRTETAMKLSPEISEIRGVVVDSENGGSKTWYGKLEIRLSLK